MFLSQPLSPPLDTSSQAHNSSLPTSWVCRGCEASGASEMIPLDLSHKDPWVGLRSSQRRRGDQNLMLGSGARSKNSPQTPCFLPILCGCPCL